MLTSSILSPSDDLQDVAAGGRTIPPGIAAMLAGVKKLNAIPGNYAACGLPYVAGVTYTPTAEIHLASLVGDGGEQLEVVVRATRDLPGFVLWTLCVKGDYVRYFNRVRLVAGMLAITVALAPEVLDAAEAGAVVEAVTTFARSLGLGSLPALSAP